ncbi:MAG: hypothetical protein UW68_C0015G0021 [Candidatus Collierbacteria bacterium GW2011_GWB1_44_6]|uniref:Uncharacterized protein n=2 Tax=Candidatus Collieribacteriota TaxID=1752725 RepID=A0A0G1JPE2_9BACT|nr:MAG: hypothetical protein UV68_C0038G0004 [Candidatus Collierbacteria bacterium GW2011_GWC2_43_12]KKT73193.1 MAG: hypothetical protein UW68_C0015G0021 [Candidatus Collierbacteria bacterium GW2011_GWB1_44_6]KKT83706.1 MAG: hypothetical protein UW80_C0008G0014 [Microgenomates group bacterium GW2011_GWC1_44_9]
MFEVTIHEDKGRVRVWIDGSGRVLEVSSEALHEGAVFGLRGDGISAVRIWAGKGSLFVLNVFSCDVAWPQDVWEFPCEFTGWAKPVKVTQLHDYLSQGLGIPAITEIV